MALVSATDPARVTDDMLAQLQEHFSGGSAPSPHDKAARQRRGFRVAFHIPQPVMIKLPGVNEDPSLVGADGSSSDHAGFGGFAGVRGDGYAIVGAFAAPIVTSSIVEAEAVRHGLRLAPDQTRALVRIDCVPVIQAIEDLLRGRPIGPGPVRDWDALNEILWHRGRLLNISLQRVPDAEGGTDSDRIPSDRLMGAAHRLGWWARASAMSGIPLEGDALDVLRHVGASEIRSTTILRKVWGRYIGGLQKAA